MRLGEEFLDELKSRLRPSDVIGRTVKLHRQGREFAGLSPFTNEKTPSFFVNDEKGFYHCFSSGKHGDVISFLQETEGLSFMEAVERLAGEAGMELPRADPRAAERAEKRKGLRHWVEEAARFYAAELRRVRGGHARKYLQGRGLGEKDWDRFGLGYAPGSRTGLKDHLVNLGAKPAELVEAGLLIQPDDNGAPYDRFRDRLMFPIGDVRGAVIAFGARALSEDQKAKYLNSPECVLFSKGKNLYRYSEARSALAKSSGRGLIVAEGYMDVIALSKAGFGAAVAPLGTALTEEQLALVWRAGPEPVLCFDGDKAGERAASRALDRALPLLEPGKTLTFAWLPAGLDPDDLLRKRGRPAMEDVLNNAQSLVDVLWKRERDRESLDTPEARASLYQRLRQCAKEIQHKELSELYRRDLFARARKELSAQRETPWRGGRGRGQGPSRELRQMVKDGRGGAPLEQRTLVAWIIQKPELLEEVEEHFAGLELHDEGLDALRNAVLDLWMKAPSVDRGAITNHVTQCNLASQLRKLESSAAWIKFPAGEAPVKAWLRVAEELTARAGAETDHAALEARLLESLMGDDRQALQRIAEARKVKRD